MRASFRQSIEVLGTLGAVLCLMGLFLADAGAGGAKKNKPDPQLQNYLKQLHGRFNEWDRDNDNVLDKSELARAFRGPGAKAFDDLPPPKQIVIPAKTAGPPKTSAPKIRPMAWLLASLPKPGLPVNLAVAELLTEATTKSAPAAPVAPATVLTAPTPNVALFGDVQFLQLLGKLKAGQVTKQDFDAWAIEYARKLDRFDEADRQWKEAQQRLKKANNDAARKMAQGDLLRHQKELRQVEAQLGTIPPAIHQALKVKR